MNQKLLEELARVRAMFQQRAITTAMDMPTQRITCGDPCEERVAFCSYECGAKGGK